MIFAKLQVLMLALEAVGERLRRRRTGRAQSDSRSRQIDWAYWLILAFSLFGGLLGWWLYTR